MSNEVRFNITGDTNAEQVAGRVKSSVGSMESQIDGIGKKFSNAFKDIFLSFFAPLALLTAALSFISKAIDEKNAKIKAAQDLAVKGESEFVDETTKGLARRRAERTKSKEEEELAKVAREEETFEYLKESSENRAKVEAKMTPAQRLKYFFHSYSSAAKQEEMQQLVAQVYKEEEVPKGFTNKDFKSPEGFSNVVGVGASPVLEAMTQQLEQQKMQTYLLQQLVAGKDQVGVDFTKTNVMKPSPYGL